MFQLSLPPYLPTSLPPYLPTSLPALLLPSTQDKAELVVIGSMIDDVASLGGLARSCEIFNVSRLVLGKALSLPVCLSNGLLL